MDYYEMRENAMGWQRRAYRAEAELAEIHAKATDEPTGCTCPAGEVDPQCPEHMSLAPEWTL